MEDTSNLTALSSFSADGTLFAFLSLAVDKHRLRVYNTASAQSVAEFTVDSARVSSLTWTCLNLSVDGQIPSPDDSTIQPSKKKRKKRNSIAEAGEQISGTQVVVLGLTNGVVLFFSPTHGRVLRALSHPASSSPILCVVFATEGVTSFAWASAADATVHLWDIQKNELLDRWKNDDRVAYSSMAVRYTADAGQAEVLFARYSMRLLSTYGNADLSRREQVASFTGHASPIQLIRWENSKAPPEQFMSMAEGDRFIYIWKVADGVSSEGSPAASIALDSDARTFSVTGSTVTVEKHTLATLSASGKVSIFPLPDELPSPVSTGVTSHKIPMLLPRSIISSSTASNAVTPVVAVTLDQCDQGSVRVARLVNGVRPIFDLVRYSDDSGSFIQNVELHEPDLRFPNLEQTDLNHRYAEPSSLKLGSGMDLVHDQQTEDLEFKNVDGHLEVDLAELSLGQRLTAVTENKGRPMSDSDEDDDDSEPHHQSKPTTRKTRDDIAVVPANTLTRTLIQALHSSDTRLLETCLAHSDLDLIRNSVRRLPPQLAIPLINACVERLGRGSRSINMKGGGGGASSQRGMGLITWVKMVLAVHAGHLMTIPDLVARLSGLHATLSARLALHESLLSLNGRLDMVLAQIEMRSSAAPAPLAPRKGKSKAVALEKNVKRYVEGESSSSDDNGDVDVEVESGDSDDGSIEDVELGGESSDNETSDEEDEDSDESSEGRTMNGFIDDEAEEYSTDDESEDE